MDIKALDIMMRDWRHDLHSHPEIGFEEHRTARLIADQLLSFGIETHENIGNAGVVGIWKKGKSDRSIGLRADRKRVVKGKHEG